jgi:hypothetical protein
MKNALTGILSYLLFVFMVFYSCDFKPSSVKDFIPGAYVRSFEGEFSKGKDTISIEPFSSSTYTIIRKTTYQRIENGKVYPPERKVEKMTALYDERDEVLNETKKGLVISFDPSRKTLLIGRDVYDKIK